MSTDESKTEPPGFAWADSPWFWLATFSAMALVAIVAIGPKYAVRQAGVERKFLARQEITRRKTAGGGTTPGTAETNRDFSPQISKPQDGDEHAARPDDYDQSDAEPATPALIVPLWRLVIVAAAVCLAATFMLLRSARLARAAP